MKSKIYKVFCVACTTMVMSSCLDTIILPDDVTVGEDFWKQKSDVALMVNAAYEGMTNSNVIRNLIVWGDFRSDELVQTQGIEGTTPTALMEVASASMQVTNMFVSWSELYSVINKCNIVLEKAASVRDADPNYEEGDYLTDRSQMLALRSLCYFYLVRNFRDVPYVDEPFMDSSKERVFVQSSPAEVLQKCIESLEEAAQNAIDPTGFGNDDWRQKGWMSRDGIHALLADIYLWRASVLHSADDYQKAIDYCDLVIAAKKAASTLPESNEYPLLSGARAYDELFANQNAEESIFELQINPNIALGLYLYMYTSRVGASGYLKASNIFKSSSNNLGTIGADKVFSDTDQRLYSSIFSHGADDESFDVRKMISHSPSTTSKYEAKSSVTFGNGSLDQNYIVYRLTDVMLMKAEAMVQQADTTDHSTEGEAACEKKLHEAFNLVQAVNNRSLVVVNGTQSNDSLQWNTLPAATKKKGGMETLVMEERLRELCFEGKRWYDLLRYNYRHVEGVQYSSLMADIGAEGQAPTYKDMLELAMRNRSTLKNGLVAKMRNEAYLYLPLPNSDVLLCPGLKQNPVYAGASSQSNQ